jgi:hypothetical protein
MEGGSLVNKPPAAHEFSSFARDKPPAAHEFSSARSALSYFSIRRYVLIKEYEEAMMTRRLRSAAQ